MKSDDTSSIHECGLGNFFFFNVFSEFLTK
jgi:hypothetical protein